LVFEQKMKMTNKGKNIILELSPEQYENLIKWAFAGQSMFYTYHNPDKKEMNEVDSLFQYLFEQGKELKNVVIKHEEGHYELSEKVSGKITGQITSFVDAVMDDLSESEIKAIQEN